MTTVLGRAPRDTSRTRTALVIAGHVVAWIASTWALTVFRVRLREEQIILAYLVLVLSGSALGPRTLGFALAVASAEAIDFFFQKPYGQFGSSYVPDLVVLLTFVAVAGVTTQLLAFARERADAANERTVEVTTLARIGSERLSTGSADAALVAIAHEIRSLARVVACSLREGDERGRVLAIATADADAGRLPPVVYSLPLVVHDTVLGLLLLHDDRAFVAAEPRRRTVEALSYYAALAIERQHRETEASRLVALEESERVRNLVLGAVSHDLRTPLTTIRTLAQSAEAGSVGPRIDQQAARLERLVHNLLDLSRMRADAFPVVLEPNVAEDLIGAVSRQVRGSERHATLQVRSDASTGMLIGLFDFPQLLRAIGNLVDNALNASPPGAVVHLSARADGSWLVFDVLDRGAGIPIADRERIFEPFQRGGGAQADGGTGLGLAIAHAVAKAHGGELMHASREGGGTAFSLRVPLGDSTGRDA